MTTHSLPTSDLPSGAALSTALIEAMSEALYVVDRSRRITYWNPAAERLTGFAASEVVGHRCRDGILNHVDEAGVVLCTKGCPLQATMRDGLPRHVAVYLHHRDGHRIPVAVSSAALRDPDGRVRGAVEVFHDDTRSHAIAAQLDAAEAASLTDPLTGLANRRSLDRALGRHQSEHRRYAHLYAVLFADIDHFKIVNDTHGHAAGDQVLRLVAATLRDCIRPSDTVGRWGGEEFVILAPVTEVEQAVALAERVRHLVESTWVDTGTDKITITLSIGVAMVRDREPATQLVARADAAMFTAKGDGRNRTALG